jgi:hypothetical protein
VYPKLNFITTAYARNVFQIGDSSRLLEKHRHEGSRRKMLCNTGMPACGEREIWGRESEIIGLLELCGYLFDGAFEYF